MDTRESMKFLQEIEGTELLDALTANVLVNQYTFECVAFGELEPGDKIPLDKFIEDLKLNKFNVYSYLHCLAGDCVTEDLRVADKPKEYFLQKCFTFYIDIVFMTAPQSRGRFVKESPLKYKRGFGEYVTRLYPLFKEILKTEVKAAPSEPLYSFTERREEAECYRKISKFLVDIKAKSLKPGGCVNRYVKDLPFIPRYVGKVLKVYKNRYLLANSDTESLDYKLAVLSAIHFMNPLHTHLFEQCVTAAKYL